MRYLVILSLLTLCNCSTFRFASIQSSDNSLCRVQDSSGVWETASCSSYEKHEQIVNKEKRRND